MAAKTFNYRVRFKKLGGHVHCTVFSQQKSAGDTWACCGNLTLCADEWVSFMGSFAAEFKEEENV